MKTYIVSQMFQRGILTHQPGDLVQILESEAHHLIAIGVIRELTLPLSQSWRTMGLPVNMPRGRAGGCSRCRKP